MATKAKAKPAAKPQDGLHIIQRPIRYHGEGEHNRQRIVPADRLLLSFSHLENAGYALLIKKRILAPATAADAKAYKDAEKARDKAMTDRERIAKTTREREKASAMAKQLKLQEELDKDGE